MRAPRHHEHRKRVRGFGYLRSLGPGLITGASDDDPSGIGTYAQVGAAFRFDLLWTAWVTLPLAVAVQETAARLALQTGKGLAALIRQRFPRAVLWMAIALVFGANVFNLGADLAAMAASIRLIVPLPFLPLLVVVTVGTLALEIFLTYTEYVRYLRWLCLSLLAYLLVLLFLEIDWGEVLAHSFLPSLQGSRAYHLAVVAVLGTTISPYLFFWQPAEEIEEIEKNRERVPVDADHITAMRADTGAGMFSAVAVMFAIMVAAGGTLNPNGITTIETAAQAARALEPIAGRWAALLFALGIVGTGLLAIPVLAGSAGYALAEAFGWREGLSKRFREAPGFYLAIVAAMVLGFAMELTGIQPMRALFFAAVLNGIAAPPLLLLLLFLGNTRTLMGDRRSGWLSNTLVGLTCALTTALPLSALAR